MTQSSPIFKKVKRFVENIIFGSRWFLIIFYLGLIVTMVTYTYVYVKEIYEMIRSIGFINKNVALMSTLEIVDIVMIANLIKMIITGSYNSFVDKSHSAEGEKISSGLLKVKMSASIVGVSSIHLLQSFIDADKTNWDVLGKQLAIHGAFLVGCIVLAFINYLHEKTEHHEVRKHVLAGHHGHAAPDHAPVVQ